MFAAIVYCVETTLFWTPVCGAKTVNRSEICGYSPDYKLQLWGLISSVYPFFICVNGSRPQTETENTAAIGHSTHTATVHHCYLILLLFITATLFYLTLVLYIAANRALLNYDTVHYCYS